MIYPYQPSGGGSGPSVNGRDLHPGDFSNWQHYYTNFPKYANATYFIQPFSAYGAGGFALTDIALNVGDEMGIIGLDSAAGYAVLFTGYLFNNMNKNQLNCYARIRLPTLPDGVNDFIPFFGFTDSVAAPVGSPGAFLCVDRTVSATNWVIRTGATAATTVDTGVAFTTSWTNLEVRKNEGGTEFKFYIDGVLVATRTTNLPTGPLGVCIGNDFVAGAGGVLHSCFGGYSVKQATPWSWASF